jgi:hypothetical protein
LLYIIGNSKYEIDLIDNRIKKYSFEELSEILMQYDIIGFGGTIFEIKQARQLSVHLIRKGKTTIFGYASVAVDRCKCSRPKFFYWLISLLRRK